MTAKEKMRKRESLVRAMGEPGEIIRGSLLERTIWHQKGCQTCARGEGHPALVLSINYPGGRNKQISIRPEQREQVERWLRNYHNVKDKLEADSGGSRLAFRTDVDHDSEVNPISILN